jgi:hypothetical protein
MEQLSNLLVVLQDNSPESKETMRMKRAWTFLMGLGVAASLTIPALAADIRGRVKSADITAHTITIIEGGKDYTFATTDATKFVDANGAALTGDVAGYLKAGTRLAITYQTQEGKSVASEVKLRDVGGKK